MEQAKSPVPAYTKDTENTAQMIVQKKVPDRSMSIAQEVSEGCAFSILSA